MLVHVQGVYMKQQVRTFCDYIQHGVAYNHKEVCTLELQQVLGTIG